MCPTTGKQCNKCGRLDHFASKYCSYKPPVNQIHDDVDTSGDVRGEIGYVTLAEVNALSAQRRATMRVHGTLKAFLLDTGADANFICIHDVFTGLGCLEGTYHIKVDKSVPPVVHPPCKDPHGLQGKLKETLNNLEAKGGVACVEQPTDWVNSLVTFLARPREQISVL